MTTLAAPAAAPVSPSWAARSITETFNGDTFTAHESAPVQIPHSGIYPDEIADDRDENHLTIARYDHSDGTTETEIRVGRTVYTPAQARALLAALTAALTQAEG